MPRLVAGFLAPRPSGFAPCGRYSILDVSKKQDGRDLPNLAGLTNFTIVRRRKIKFDKPDVIKPWIFALEEHSQSLVPLVTQKPIDAPHARLNEPFVDVCPDHVRVESSDGGRDYLRNVFLETRFVALAEYDQIRARRLRSQSQAAPGPIWPASQDRDYAQCGPYTLVRGKVLTR